jgi:hypothetical protein
MTQVEFGPTNLTQGNSAFFTAEFFDSNGNLTIPSGATLQITYTNINNASQTDTVTLSAVNSYFTGTWSSTSASYGLAPWSIFATGNSTAAQMGIIRVVDP